MMELLTLVIRAKCWRIVCLFVVTRKSGDRTYSQLVKLLIILLTRTSLDATWNGLMHLVEERGLVRGATLAVAASWRIQTDGRSVADGAVWRVNRNRRRRGAVCASSCSRTARRP